MIVEVKLFCSGCNKEHIFKNIIYHPIINEEGANLNIETHDEKNHWVIEEDNDINGNPYLVAFCPVCTPIKEKIKELIKIENADDNENYD